MIDVNILFSSESLSHVSKVAWLHNSLMSIKEEGIEELHDQILSSHFIEDQEGTRCISRALFNAAKYRPYNLKLIVGLTCKIVNSANNLNQLGNLKSELLNFPHNINKSKWVVAFIAEALAQSLYSPEEINQEIKNYFEHNPVDTLGQHTLFAWFAPLLEQANNDLYSMTLSGMQGDLKDGSLNKEFISFVKHFDFYKKENWKYHTKMRLNVYANNSVMIAIKNNDLEKLQEMASKPKFNPNLRIGYNTFEFCPILRYNPTISQFAAFCGSKECFKHLLLIQADANLTDESPEKHPLTHFAAASGDVETVQLCEDLQISFIGTTQVACEFHHQTMFQWLYATKSDVLNEDGPFGSVFSKSITSINLNVFLQCIEHECDINLKDKNEFTPLMLAARNGVTDIVKFLLQSVVINVNYQDSTGATALHWAAQNGYKEIVELLIQAQGIDLSIKNKLGVFLLFSGLQLRLRVITINRKSFKFYQKSCDYYNKLMIFIPCNLFSYV